jgi:WD40 repeat protein
MVLSSEGFYLALSSVDHEVKSLNTRYMQIDREGKQHEEDIKSIAFTEDTRFIMTTCVDNTYKFIPNIRAPGNVRSLFQFLMLMFLAIYVYKKIQETFFY